MKMIILLLSVSLMILLSCQNIYGQTENTKKVKFGLGISLFNLSEQIDLYNYSPMNSIYMTIDVPENIRIEPSISFVLVEQESRYNVGLGVFGIKSFSKLNMLYGLRVGVHGVGSYKDDGSFSDNNLFLLSPTIGAEYFLIDRFSLGAEVQLRGLFFNDQIAVTTYSSLLIRFYFNCK